MIKNRPSLSLIPNPNKRLISQYLARNLFTGGAVLLTSFVLLYKFFVNANSAPFLKTRKSFNFQADPYTGKVNCTFQDVPNYQHGF
jgi:hypothetical protein